MFNKILGESKKIADRSKDMVEVIKLKSTIDKNEAEITKRKTELGALVYRLQSNGKISDPDVDGLCEIIQKLNKEIYELNAQIMGLQTRELICASCGSTNDVSTKFCARCGKELSSALNNGVACPKCSFGNKAGDGFCAKCGTKLTEVNEVTTNLKNCPKCAFGNSPTDGFCSKCGTKL